jgi:hypothetical protein
MALNTWGSSGRTGTTQPPAAPASGEEQKLAAMTSIADSLVEIKNLLLQLTQAIQVGNINGSNGVVMLQKIANRETHVS